MGITTRTRILNDRHAVVGAPLGAMSLTGNAPRALVRSYGVAGIGDMACLGKTRTARSATTATPS
ncbi:hypothetical protein AE929_17030, partial [Xanthomonas arboricola]